jgi:hypothetical protein
MIKLGQSQVTKAHTAIFQPKIGVTKSRNIDEDHQSLVINFIR